MTGSSTTTSQKQNQQTASTAEPWKPAQPLLMAGMGIGSQLYADGIGGQIYSGNTTAPFSQPTQQGLQQGVAMAGQANPFASTALNYAQNTLQNNGANPFMADAYAKYQPTASGAMLGQNPFLQGALDFQSNKVADKVNSIFSGAGRTGSGAHAGTLGNELAGLRFGASADNYNFERGQQMQAIGDQANLGRSAMDNANNILGQAGTLEALPFNNIDRMMQLGGKIEGKQQDIINENIRKFEAGQEAPWSQLSRLLGTVSPFAQAFPSSTGTMSGTGTSVAKTPFNPMSLAGIPMMAAGK